MRKELASSSSDVTALLRAWSDGDRGALERLLPIVYDGPSRLARCYLRGEHARHSLQTTALANEAYVRLVDYMRMQWQNHAHFFAVASHGRCGLAGAGTLRPRAACAWPLP